MNLTTKHIKRERNDLFFAFKSKDRRSFYIFRELFIMITHLKKKFLINFLLNFEINILYYA
jgi:hypothetical protein